ncbi:hypothetical protein ACFLZT_00690 [Thermodesulfobacteriota bacterium]
MLESLNRLSIILALHRLKKLIPANNYQVYQYNNGGMMFIGHYAVGFGLKKKCSEIPLWLLFLSVQIVDVFAFLFVLLGIEGIKYNPSANPFLRTVIEYVPYSHSLLTNVLLAIVVFLAVWKMKGKEWGIIISLGVLSHWFLDALVHLPDMPLFHNSMKVGLGLWRLPWIAFLLELSVFVFAGSYLLRGYRKKKRHVTLMLFLSLGFVLMFFAPEAEATPVMASIMSLSLYTISTAMAYWCDRGGRIRS